MDATLSDCSEKLCAQARAGDREAAAQLVTLHYQRIYAFLRRLCGNEDDAAELTQKTFAKVWEGLASYEGRSSFSTWAHAIARYVYLNWRRQAGRLESAGEAWWEAQTTEGPSPFEDAAERDLAAHLYALVERLDEEKREVIHLHYFQGLSLKETSEVLGVAESTVKYRLRTALDYLRKQPLGVNRERRKQQ